MTADTEFGRAAKSGVRTVLGITGVLALIAGIIIVWQPAGAAKFVTLVLAVYAIAAGLAYIGLGIFTVGKGGWARVGHVLLGLVFIAAGIIAFLNPAPTTAWLAFIVALWIGIAWIVEGIVSLSTLSFSPSKGWTIFFAIVSIIAGIYLLFSPILGALALWLILGISLIVIGILNIVRAFAFGK